MAETKVRLTRKWSDWDAGDVVTLESEKAKRVIAKGYGVKDRGKPPADKSKGPAAETATAEPSTDEPGETDKADSAADTQASKPAKKGKPTTKKASGKGGD
jgi:hypothetical protein